MTADQVYTVARQAGFTPDAAVMMTALARRESSYQPGVVRYVAASDPLVLSKKQLPEYSIGLWQINMVGAIGEQRLRALNLTSADQLKDPLTNARAAYWLSQGGQPAVVHQHWRIWQAGPPWYYKENYEKHLPEARAAQARVEGGSIQAPGSTPHVTTTITFPSDGDESGGGAGPLWPVASESTGSGSESNIALIAGAGVLALALVFVLTD